MLQRKCDCGKHTFAGAKCSDCSSAESVQRKADSSALIVSEPGDAMEIEADRMAEQVIGGGAGMRLPPRHTTPMVQREADDQADASSDDDVEEDSLPDMITGVDTVGDASGRPKLTAQASGQAGRQRVAIPQSGGAGMAPAVRGFMESRFAHNFSAVRVHTGADAARSAQALQAHAYTVGRNIYFSQGSYQPDQLEGRRLLAHELTHVVQQTGGAPLSAQRKPKKATSSGKKKAGQQGSTATAKVKAKVKPKCAKGTCDNTVASAVESEVRHPFCGNEKCEPGAAASATDFIRHLDVNLATQNVTAEFGNDKVITSRKVMLSSPNPSTTPKGKFKIGLKCGPCHTNMAAHGMGWFTGFHNDLEFGFHNSQKVGKGVRSLACVRTFVGDAKWIHDNTASGVTTVCVHNGDHCKPAAKAKAKPKVKPSFGGGASPVKAAPPLVSEAGASDDDGDQEEMTA
jgi:hypothetical protein